MGGILLSVLICTVPNRRRLLAEVWDSLHCGILDAKADGCVEVLALCDNKARSIGAKRQALLDIAQGEYIAYVDDDDGIHVDYMKELLKAIGEKPDLIVWPINVTINGGEEGIVEPSIKYVPKEGETLAEYKPPVTNRPPHELCCWRTEIARKGRFPDTSKGEDFLWAAQCWPYVKTEIRIPKTLYWWRHEIARREHVE